MPKVELTRILDRLGGRAILGVAASALLTIKGRRLCRVHYVKGAWVHRHGERTIIESKLILTSPEELDARVCEMFLPVYRPQPGDVVLDVGASVGRETVLFSRLVGPSGRVIAVEAHPATFAMLKETIRRNGLTNVTAMHRAVGADNSTVFMTDDSEDHTRNRVSHGKTGVRVPGVALSDLMDEVGITRIDFLKMNIEGAEGPSITAMGPQLATVANACISCHDFVADLTGDETYRTKEVVRGAFAAVGFSTSSRADDRLFIRDVVYASWPDVATGRGSTPKPKTRKGG